MSVLFSTLYMHIVSYDGSKTQQGFAKLPRLTQWITDGTEKESSNQVAMPMVLGLVWGAAIGAILRRGNS